LGDRVVELLQHLQGQGALLKDEHQLVRQSLETPEDGIASPLHTFHGHWHLAAMIDNSLERFRVNIAIVHDEPVTFS
jgi:hypothetical protein